MADWTRLGPFVAAMYTVTAREMDDAIEQCRSTKTRGGQEIPARKMDPEHMPLISFPWLFASELGRIATEVSVSVVHHEDSVQAENRLASSKPDSSQSAPATLVVPEGKRNVKQVFAVKKLGGQASENARTAELGTMKASKEGLETEADVDQKAGTEVKLDTKTPSALDLLMRLGQSQ